MGILAANIVAFGQPFQAYMYPDAFLTEHGPVSDWLLVAQFVIIDSKMRGLFTLLFGAGLYLFMERTWARGGTRWRQIWRLFILLLFGLIHYYLIWAGDILLYYAVIGFLIVPCLKWGAEAQLLTGLIGFVFGALLYSAMLTFPYLVAETSLGEQAQFSEVREGTLEAQASALADSNVETELIRSGDYAGVLSHRLSEHGADPIGNVLIFALETIPLMLLGVALYRLGFFGGGFPSRKMRLWGWTGLIIGALLNFGIGLFLMSTGFGYYAMLAAFVGWSSIPQLLMVLGLAALMVEYSDRWRGELAERVRAAGRAAFTNYLGTSILMLFVFQGWALGLFGELSRPELYLVTLLTCGLMLLWSKPWLERFRYGPLEWLWRCLTYGKVFPIRR
ncbi:DUF418 domain-containing protein [Erythrobacter sp. KMU-140]|uniref:DUF418 domain-containing protein n=2 Tax=Erythrobacter rubeus TaxID=2760803 RepID=A0ABR8KWS3_9SPHN|nr:DUF418 domain-containing protein [Erythrobacter rubeus]